MKKERVARYVILESGYYCEYLIKYLDSSWEIEKVTWGYHDDRIEEYERISPKKAYKILKHRKHYYENNLRYNNEDISEYKKQWYKNNVEQIKGELELLEKVLPTVPSDYAIKNKIGASGRLSVKFIEVKKHNWNNEKTDGFVYDINNSDILLLIDKIIEISKKYGCTFKGFTVQETSPIYEDEWGYLYYDNIFDNIHIVKSLNNIGYINFPIFIGDEIIRVSIQPLRNILEIEIKHEAESRAVFGQIFTDLFKLR